MSEGSVPGSRPIRLVQGDITRIETDAIVNAANSGLRGGGGVDGAIHRAGGPAVMADLERRYGPARHCPTGSAVVGAAGDLPARIVIHAVGPIWRGGEAGEAELLASAYRRSLELARDAAVRRVSFPAISCGIYGYPVDRAARVALSTVRAFLDTEPGSVEEVTFVLFSADTLAAFEEAQRDLEAGPDAPTS